MNAMKTIDEYVSYFKDKKGDYFDYATKGN
mgnify:CR=1 FL=1